MPNYEYILDSKNISENNVKIFKDVPFFILSKSIFSKFYCAIGFESIVEKIKFPKQYIGKKSSSKSVIS